MVRKASRVPFNLLYPRALSRCALHNNNMGRSGRKHRKCFRKGRDRMRFSLRVEQRYKFKCAFCGDIARKHALNVDLFRSRIIFIIPQQQTIITNGAVYDNKPLFNIVIFVCIFLRCRIKTCKLQRGSSSIDRYLKFLSNIVKLPLSRSQFGPSLLTW